MFKTIVNDIDSVLARDPAARSRLEVILCYPGVHALIFHRLSNWLWRSRWKLPARMVSYISRFITGIEIHPGATIGNRFFIDHGMGVVIGETSRIGDDVTIYHDVTLGGTSLNKGLRHPQIGNNVIIGAGAQLLGPIVVGENARVGSNAVVTKDVASDTTVVGIPARPVAAKVPKDPEDQAFKAYGTPQDDEADPLAVMLHKLRNDMANLQMRVSELEQENSELIQSAKKWESK
jgi:serine O-acetyltransferase